MSLSGKTTQKGIQKISYDLLKIILRYDILWPVMDRLVFKLVLKQLSYDFRSFQLKFIVRIFSEYYLATKDTPKKPVANVVKQITIVNYGCS